MRKRIFALLLAAALLCGCQMPVQPEMKQYNATFLDVFDTVTAVVGRAESQESFQAEAQKIHDDLLYYHQLFDIYNNYADIANLKTVNDQAGIAPVKVEKAIIDLLLDCRDYYEKTGGKVNVAMGSVLKIWHDARESLVLPQEEDLLAAKTHCSWDTVIIDEENSTVYVTDPSQRLDVGAVAKGWAVQRVAEKAPKGLLLSVGGNVVATGPKKADGTPWVVGVNDPDGGSAYLHTLNISGGAVVTSGDYQRYFVVENVVYHHIIDPETLYPSKHWRSVTIICPDSGLADALSTALFVLPLEEGKALVQSCGAQAMWVDGNGSFYYSDGFDDFIRT
jgi:thiamine biosynthesis lipoprotein